MARLIEIPEMRWIGGAYPWRLESALVYQSEVLRKLGLPENEPGILRIAAGYRTDLASVPRIPFVYAWTGGRASIPAIVHDYLYDCWTDHLERRDADRVFREAMRIRIPPPEPAHGVLARLRRHLKRAGRALTRGAMFAGVRLGGWRGWRQDSRKKCPCCDPDA